MSDLDQVRLLLAGTDPLPEGSCAGAAEAPQGRALLARILASPGGTQVAKGRSRASTAPRRSLLSAAAAAAIALLVAGVVVLGPGGGSTPATAATPPVLPYETSGAAPAGPTLRRIAAAAAALPAPLESGPYRYVRTQSWAVNSAISGGRVTSVLAGQQSETWRLPDGTGRARTTAGENLVDRVGSRETLDAALARPADRDQDLAADGHTPPPLVDLDRLPTDTPAAFARAVEPGANTSLPVGALVAQYVRQVFAEQPVPPGARADIWRLLATVPGVTDRGTLTDRVGRQGTAITLDDDGTAHGLPEQYLFIIDPADGQLLEYDNVLTTDPGKLNVRVPAVLGLTVYLDAGYTSRPTGRPAQ